MMLALVQIQHLTTTNILVLLKILCSCSCFNINTKANKNKIFKSQTSSPFLVHIIPRGSCFLCRGAALMMSSTLRIISAASAADSRT